MITTIDQANGLEAYVSVPLERASDLRPGLPVELLDGEGEVIATNPITFIAPRADDATQSVLVKAPLPRGGRRRCACMQYVRARIVWSSEPALTVPVVAVNRISGQYFVFVAENDARQGHGGATEADLGRRDRRRRLRRARRPEGGRARDRLERPEARRRRARSRGWADHDVRRHLHPASDPGVRLLARHRPRRRPGDPDDAGGAVPGRGAAAGQRVRDLHGRQRRGGRDGGDHAARAGHQRRRGHALHDLVEHATAACRRSTSRST